MFEYSIILNKECNRKEKCSFCYQKGNFISKVVSKKDIDLFLSSINKDVFNISIIGGEPLIHKDLVYYILEHNILNYANKIILYTNTDLLNIEDIEYFNRRNVLIKTNMDFLIGKKLFVNDNKFNLIKMMKNKDIHFIIDKFNLDRLIDFCSIIIRYKKILLEIGLKFHLMNPTIIDFNKDDIVKIIKFYNTINEPILFDSYIQAISNFDNYTYINKGSFKNSTSCLSNCLNNKLVLNPNGEITMCDYIEPNNKTDVKKYVENSKMICKECIFSSLCLPCQLNYNEFIREYKCRRIINIFKANYSLLNSNKKVYDTNDFSLTINTGSKCNFDCSFCYNQNSTINEPNLEKLSSFLKSNYFKFIELDSIAGGEPLIYLNSKYQFLLDYFQYINVTTNLSIKNEWVKNNKDKIVLNPSIHSINDLKHMKFDYYCEQIGIVNIMMSIENIKNIYKIKSYLESKNINYKFVFLFEYSDKDKIFLNNNKEFIYNIVKSNKYTVTYLLNSNKSCINKRIHYFEEKFSICNIYNFYANNRIETNSDNFYEINLLLKKIKIKELKSNCPALDVFFKWTSEYIGEIIRRIKYDKETYNSKY